MVKLTVKGTKILWTLAFYLSFFALGLCVAIAGPTLIDLQQIVQTSTGKLGYIYLARSSGYLVGSVIGGIIYDLLGKPDYLLIICNLIMGLSAIATPWSRSLEVLMSILAVGGIALGMLDIGINVLCLNIWGKESAPYYQALHFLFGVGGFLAPLIAAPFLSSQNNEDSSLQLLSGNESTIFISNLTNLENATIHLSKLNASHAQNSVFSITYAYLIIGAFAVCVTLLFLILTLFCPHDNSSKDDITSEVIADHGRIFTILVAGISALLLGTYCGMEIGYAQMLATFAVKGSLKLTKSTASFMTAVFWGTFTFTRGVSVFLSTKFSPFTLVFSNLVIVLLGSGVLVLFGNTSVKLLWVGTVLLAIGLASFYPCVITWIERYIEITNKIASLPLVAAAAGEMVVPLVVSNFIESFPLMLMYIVLACAISSSALTFLLWLIMTRKGEKRSNVTSKTVNPCEHNSSL